MVFIQEYNDMMPALINHEEMQIGKNETMKNLGLIPNY
jgi:hypothetical protein